MKHLSAVAVTVAVGVVVLLTGSRPVYATMEIQKSAKAAGITEATSCVYCHVEKLPKKGASTNNDRGKWLHEEMEKRKAKEPDPAWLKDYVEKKKADETK